jgi:uroporphyrin-III C-methyltransferase/precorrin-2 dehydrogenase/sirohydrochlorin ferrochelatase
MDYLPLFLDLRGQCVLVVGGGIVAARKIEHLLKAQAQLRVVSPELGPELAALRDAGRLEHLAQLFEPQVLDGARLVVAATDDEAVNEAVSQAAQARGLWVNVVDDARRSSFIFPAIVDRSPVVIAIGTEGSSPTLARRVRTQIEALLPERLGELAAYASRWRGAVKAVLPALPERLRFWDGFFASPVATQLLSGSAEGADAAMQVQLDSARAVSGGHRGEVYLIGVGPGDPDLLTIRAQQLLQQADVLLYDRLVPQVIIDRARRDAEKINVGKLPGNHEVTQNHINRLLLEHAQRGLRVARVKGGDPFVFGRGGEELQLLRAAGIPVVVVPGITAALGAAASTGIPLTQRGVSQSVTFVTATGAHGDSLDWRALAGPLQTVVFYMGVGQLDQVVAQLTQHGLPVATAVALVERATWPDQRVLHGTLGGLLALAQGAALQSPTLLVVGEVTALGLQAAVAEQQAISVGERA